MPCHLEAAGLATTEHPLSAELGQQRGAAGLDGLRFIFEKVLVRGISEHLVDGESEAL